MILAFDVGNTETTIGAFEGADLRAHWRITTSIARTADEFSVLLRGLLEGSGIGPQRATGAVIGSVVPGVTEPLRAACAGGLVDGQVIVVDARAALPITLDVDEPLTVGADRLVNTLAASQMFGSDAIVVDLGTATTFDCITSEGVFLGGVIAPGVQTALESLVRRTSKLPATELRVPAQIIGKRTEECIRAGVMYGAAESIDGIVRRIRADWPREGRPVVIATGGLAENFRPLCAEFDRVEPYLTLQGLQLAFGILSTQNG